MHSFLTNKRYLGQCEGDLRARDEIFLLDGSEHLFILRREGRRNEFAVVGKTKSFGLQGRRAISGIQATLSMTRR